MRATLSLALLLLAASASADTPHVVTPLPNASFLPQGQLADSPFLPGMNLANRTEPANCRTKIETVNETPRLRKLDRPSASPDNPLFIYAVDTRVDGCRVMLAVGGGLLASPAPVDGDGRMMPAK